MAASYDLVAIGTGTAAKIVVMRAQAANWRVAIIDSRPFGAPVPCAAATPRR
ncbi:hypothetical protein HSBAA_PA_2890 (plasmid) [Vreelandella sulfidaeris]|uniref:FAD-dependent oxidoreductase 2 FAD binding domain-containing protein n=1 Tax=Vreelandella sulfidaeris TaxID=115553 RepID=A0A455UHF6_9GAMM|nr:hypothetical protein HSBAA_PA_2890 [Halomonas sulfidaeris]